MIASVIIDRPPNEIANVLLDAEKAVLWTSDLKRFEIVSRPPGLVGSKALLHYEQGGRQYIMEDELLEFEPDRRFLSRVSGDAIEAEVETVLSPSNGGTRVEVRWTGSGKHLILSFMLPFMRRTIKRQTDLDLSKLKALVESL